MPNSNLGDIIQQPIDDVAIVSIRATQEEPFRFEMFKN